MDRRLSIVLGSALCVLALQGPQKSHAAFVAFQVEGDGSTHPVSADGKQETNPHITAHGLDGAGINMDGRLDDPAWVEAEAGRGFQGWDPVRGGEASEETVFKVAYDQEAVYFAVACFEKDMSNVSSNLARRDRFSYSDLVSIYIDPYHDKQTGYNFKVNPEGVKIDSYLSGNGNSNDENWDAVWQAETSRDDEGWYAEIRIPFSSIRYRPAEEMTWGLQVYRYMHGRGEDTAWKVWDRELNGFISNFGELRGLRNVPNPRQLEIMPYALGKSFDGSIYGPESGPDDLVNDLNFGTDLKYGVTADLTLNATFLPDFGQVEADPAELNLSPFETYFEEKRTFFIEGNQYFNHPDFNLFYSRRIGTGFDDARIRGATKLTGKTKDNISLGLLAATTDVTAKDTWNLFKTGEAPRSFLISRVGKEFNDGNQSFNLMGTMVRRHDVTGFDSIYNDPDEGDSTGYGGRTAYTGGMDFNLFWKDRTYNIQGSTVFSNIITTDRELVAEDVITTENPGVWGTGGALDIRKVAGTLQSGLWGRWEGDRLNLNDAGFLGAPDEIFHGYWLSHSYNPEGESKVFNRANSNFNIYRGFLYGARTGDDVDGNQIWSYGKGLPSSMGGNFNGWMQFKNYYEAWWGIEYTTESRNRWDTRGGPLMLEPETYGGWYGAATDYRKKVRLEVDGHYFADVENNLSWGIEAEARWNMSSTMTHEISIGFQDRVDDSQYMGTVESSDATEGLGGFSYVFGEIDQQTVDITLRSSILFSRDQSLDLYLQPYLSVGNYDNIKRLARPDSYEFEKYEDQVMDTDGDGNDIMFEDNDFNFVSVNLNLVYRWEFRPGSTLYLVWAHARDSSINRYDDYTGFNNKLNGSELFQNEPTNTFMSKITYWFNM